MPPLRDMDIRRRAHVGRADFFEAMFSEVLNVLPTFLKRPRHRFEPSLVEGWLSNLFADCMEAVLRITRQNENGNRIRFIEPKQDCAFELTDFRALLGCNQDIETRPRPWFEASFATHKISASLSAWRNATQTKKPYDKSKKQPTLSRSKEKSFSHPKSLSASYRKPKSGLGHRGRLRRRRSPGHASHFASGRSRRPEKLDSRLRLLVIEFRR
jgi:hypothetical protein